MRTKDSIQEYCYRDGPELFIQGERKNIYIMSDISNSFTFACLISVYNGEEYIGRCLESILGQDLPFDNIIVYDDASSDGTVDLVFRKLEKYKEKSQLIVSEVNRGPGGGKDYAARLVDTDYFMFVDADDYIDNDYLMVLAEEIDRWKQVNGVLPDIIVSDFKGVDPEGRLRYTRKFRNWHTALYTGVSNWGKLFRREFWKEHNLSIPSGKVLDDVLLRACIVASNPVVIHTKRTNGYNYMYNPASVSHTYMKSFIEGAGKEEIRYLYSYRKLVSKDKEEEYLYWVYKIYCWHLLKSGAGVGVRSMRKEYEQMRFLLNSFFPKYKFNRYLVGRKSLKDERAVVKLAVRGMYMMEMLHIQRIFLYAYSKLNLSWLWPKM